jgi:hypothetical protein
MFNQGARAPAVASCRRGHGHAQDACMLRIECLEQISSDYYWNARSARCGLDEPTVASADSEPRVE